MGPGLAYAIVKPSSQAQRANLGRGSTMAIHVNCKCGRTLRFHAAKAGKKFACPYCGQAFRAAAAAGQSTSPTEHSSAAELHPAATPSSLDPQPANLDDELLMDSLQAPPAAVEVEGLTIEPLKYAQEEDPNRKTRSNRWDIVSGPNQSFWSDALTSFAYPVRSTDNCISCFVILVASGMSIFLRFTVIMGPMGLLFGILGLFFLYGYLAALYFNVIHETSAGSDDLPGFLGENGVADDIIYPAFKFLGAIAVALGPSVILSIAIYFGWVPASWSIMHPIWLAVGAFLLPISLLLFAFDTPGLLLRPDLIALLVFRTFLPYLSIWLVLSLVAALFVFTILGPEFFGGNKPIMGSGSFASGLGLTLFITLLRTYLLLVAMRIIGLYYLHFKKRFPFAME